MDSFLAFIENGALSTFIRETPTVFVFPAILTLHTIGMGVLAGGSIAIDLRILGFAPKMALAPIGRFFPVLWLALVVNALSGILLLIAYPTKALTNPLFYVKLLLITLAVVVLLRLKRRIFDDPRSSGCRSSAGTSVWPSSRFLQMTMRGGPDACPRAQSASARSWDRRRSGA